MPSCECDECLSQSFKTMTSGGNIQTVWWRSNRNHNKCVTVQTFNMKHCLKFRSNQQGSDRMLSTAHVYFWVLSVSPHCAILSEERAFFGVGPCVQETDGAGGAFGFKLWTYRVLQEIIHWAEQAALTLHLLHQEREGTGDIWSLPHKAKVHQWMNSRNQQPAFPIIYSNSISTLCVI